MPKQVTNNVVQTMELIKNTTGVDLTKLVAKYSDEATDAIGQGSNGHNTAG